MAVKPRDETLHNVIQYLRENDIVLVHLHDTPLAQVMHTATKVGVIRHAKMVKQGMWLTQTRRNASMTVPEAAQTAGVDTSTWRKWEFGQHQMPEHIADTVEGLLANGVVKPKQSKNLR